jgi:hypothetical protein
MKIKFRDIRLSADNKKKLEVINSIIREYQRQGYVLTLRQLYYQLVSRDIIPNALSEYAKISKLLKEGRMSGIVDWDAIEDRLRKPQSPSAWNMAKDMMIAAIQQFQCPRMEGQSNYVEVWVEKDALSGVLKRVTEKYHVPILVNRGYSSASAMFDSYNRFKNAIENKQRVKILYLGDYDPSGIDMIRDIRDRIIEFMAGSSEIEDLWNENDDYSLDTIESYIDEFFEIKPIALTIKQIQEYNPPPNPAKRSDPRAAQFIKELGNTSWEVDALKPEVLHALLEDNIQYLIDMDLYEECCDREQDEKDILIEFKNTL